MDSNIIRKFRLIIWKNFIIRQRHWVLTCLEIIIPVLLFILLAYIRGNIGDINRMYINETTYFPPKNVDSLTEEITADTNIFYTNIKPFYGNLMNDVRKKIALPATSKYFISFQIHFTSPRTTRVVTEIFNQRKYEKRNFYVPSF